MDLILKLLVNGVPLILKLSDAQIQHLHNAEDLLVGELQWIGSTNATQ